MRRVSLSYKTILQGIVIGTSTMVVLVVLIGNAMNREDYPFIGGNCVSPKNKIY